MIHKLPQIIERDGGEWVCHYCGHALIPYGAPVSEPYYHFVMTRVAHPATTGDCDGRYTYEEVLHAIDLTINRELFFWLFDWQRKPEYRHAYADHVVPRSKGGSNKLDNLVAACYQCNQAKRDKDCDVFMQELAERKR